MNMKDVKDLLINTLENAFGYDVILQGSMSDDAKYPDSFFTYFNNETSDTLFFDNNETVVIWDFDLNIYSNDPAIVNSALVTAKQVLKEQGFIIDGVGHDVLSDEPSHTGRGITVLYVEKVR